MRQEDADTELDGGLDGAVTEDYSDDPCPADNNDCVRATRIKSPKKQGRKGGKASRCKK